MRCMDPGTVSESGIRGQAATLLRQSFEPDQISGSPSPWRQIDQMVSVNVTYLQNTNNKIKIKIKMEIENSKFKLK